MSRFKVIDGGDTPRPYHKRGQWQQWVCRVCEHDVGVATSMTVAADMAGGFTPKGQYRQGEATRICAHCLSRGKITRVT